MKSSLKVICFVHIDLVISEIACLISILSCLLDYNNKNREARAVIDV